jgi:hypothetical protein
VLKLTVSAPVKLGVLLKVIELAVGVMEAIVEPGGMFVPLHGHSNHQIGDVRKRDLGAAGGQRAGARAGINNLGSARVCEIQRANAGRIDRPAGGGDGEEPIGAGARTEVLKRSAADDQIARRGGGSANVAVRSAVSQVADAQRAAVDGGDAGVGVGGGESAGARSRL